METIYTDFIPVILHNGTRVWQSNTAGKGGAALVALNRSPWLEILNATGQVIWSTLAQTS
jgi:hypothetical protein